MKRVLLKDLSSNVLNLPRLPVPELNKTSERYRASIAPLKSAEAVANHLKKFDTFLATSAPKLNKILLDLEESRVKSGSYPYSYVEKAWSDMYLGGRSPLVVHTNPAFSLKPLKGNYTTQSGTAAALMYGLAKHIRTCVVEGVLVKNPKLDISPQLVQFGAAVVPHPLKDQHVSTPLEKVRHVVVLHDGHPYRLSILDDNGEPLTQAQIQKAIDFILTITPDADNTTPVSVLTSASRTLWATAYSELIKTPENVEVLKNFNEAALVLCLDSKSWGSDAILKQGAILHGNKEEMENRWFDKHQIIVSADGQVALNFEHSSSDGVQWVNWIEEVVATAGSGDGAAVTAEAASVDSEKAAALVKPLKVTFGKSFSSHIRSARNETESLIKNVGLNVANIPFGKVAIKGINMSPDAFTQMAFQVAYFNKRNKMPPTYEASSTAGFFHGRTETIRSCTEGMAKVAEALTAASTSNTAPTGDELKALINKAAATHVGLAQSASQGQGVDRHLYILKQLAVTENAEDALAFFDDELYKYATTWLLSTSNVSNPLLEYFNFGPVAANGYGVGYVVDNDAIRCSVSGFVDSAATDVAELSEAIVEASEKIYTAMNKPKRDN